MVNIREYLWPQLYKPFAPPIPDYMPVDPLNLPEPIQEGDRIAQLSEAIVMVQLLVVALP